MEAAYSLSKPLTPPPPPTESPSPEPPEEGCFSAKATVQLEDGSFKLIKDVGIKDKVLAVDKRGKQLFSEIVLLMDVVPDYVGEFVAIEAGGRHLHLTPAHLLFIAGSDSSSFDPVSIFAGQVKKGQYVHVVEPVNGGVEKVRIERVCRVQDHGAYAPLTEEGTIVVDNILASCYAVFSNPKVAHWSLAPFRWLHSMNKTLEYFINASLNLGQDPKCGIAWYPSILYQIAEVLYIV
ncbi:tiggy-winkle hedgehog protein-like [Protopterus annectens]|uniref:tiggy-winkle hedgehog protein-like n=1 Tax=Protopterus annectens TaxID=7888 RepID=UPI001CF97630|nr:tiggy-winkle hedgehog protein-like [Protopterus annectens]XP_043914741.1 tiggy-winkle hedgehog protein-like [Protopterus annectens]